MRILLVEDNERLASVIAASLRGQAHQVRVAPTKAEAISALDDDHFDLAILDVALPDGSGLDVCRHARADGHALAILMLTASNGTGHRIEGLDAGADDYLGKPFDPGELAARVRALGRRGPRWTSAVHAASGLVIDRERRTVLRDGRTIPLTVRELEIVALLAFRDGRVASRDEILEAIWGTIDEGSARSLDVLVGRIRRKLDAPGAPSHIRTIRNVGYAWVDRP